MFSPPSPFIPESLLQKLITICSVVSCQDCCSLKPHCPVSALTLQTEAHCLNCLCHSLDNPKSLSVTCFAGHFTFKVLSIDNVPMWEQEALDIKETEDNVLSLVNL